MKYRVIKDIYCGFIDLKIKDIYYKYPYFFKNKNILVTCIDSCNNILKLYKWLGYLNENKIKYKTLKSAILIHNSCVEIIFIQNRTFLGFDEIYLFNKYENIDSIPEKHYTTDGFNFGEDVPEDFLEYFAQSSADSFFADGCGMNFAFKENTHLVKLKNMEKN